LNDEYFQKCYRQPSFYKFSEDSIILSKIVLDHIEQDKAVHILDAGAGCGVVGVEIAKKLSSKSRHSLKLLEKEKEFLPFIKENIARFLPTAIDVNIYHEDFLNFRDDGPFTHIVCNPPYFFTGEGRASPYLRKNNCRFWDKKKAADFLQHLFSTCQQHQAQGFFCAREELKKLMDSMGLEYRILKTKGKTYFISFILSF